MLFYGPNVPVRAVHSWRLVHEIIIFPLYPLMMNLIYLRFSIKIYIIRINTGTDTIIPAEAHQCQLIIGGVPPHPEPDYFCHLCPFEGTFKEVAIHHIDNHKNSVLNFYKRVISTESGK